MCGIIGSFQIERTRNFEDKLHAGLNAMINRGPDGEGLDFFDVANGRLALGHRRLSIIDLTDDGRQPMVSANKRFTITYNGEIYNYKELRKELQDQGHVFSTQSDTEVLLAAWQHWGEACLKRLVGMFAFVIFDKDDEKLYCVRDAFGIKPFFYNLNNGLNFASDMNAIRLIMTGDVHLNYQSIYDYLAYGLYDTGNTTFLDDVEQLLPSELMVYDLNKARIVEKKKWWAPKTDRRDVGFEQAAKEFREVLIKTVRLHMRSDVPIGVALSGGLDSSVIACVMRHIDPDMDIHSFSYVAKGYKNNEEKWVDIVNQHIGAIAHKIEAGSEGLQTDYEDLIHAHAEPFANTTIYAQYKVAQSVKEHGVTVLLEGQGADEMLAGYQGYPLYRTHSLLEMGEYVEAAKFLYHWKQHPGRQVKKILDIIATLFLPGKLNDYLYRSLLPNIKPDWLNWKLLESHNVKAGVPDRIRVDDDLKKGRRLVEKLQYELTQGGLQGLTRQGDRNNMRWSIENRVPFLTTEMVDFLLQLPEEYLVSPQGQSKYILREAMRGIVPDAIFSQRIRWVSKRQKINGCATYY